MLLLYQTRMPSLQVKILPKNNSCKNDPTLKANSVTINGVDIPDELMQQGQTLLEFPAGAVGEREINGEFVFLEEGDTIRIPVESKYAVFQNRIVQLFQLIK